MKRRLLNNIATIVFLLVLATGALSAPSQFTTTGNMGVGTTSPEQKLHVDGTLKTSQNIAFPDGTTQSTSSWPDGLGWQVLTSSFVETKSISAQEGSARGLTFSPDGTIMFVTGSTNDNINRYNLSDPWNVSTATFIENQTLTPYLTPQPAANPVSIHFSPDGRRMFIGDSGIGNITQFDLSEAWNVTTLTQAGYFLDIVNADVPQGIFFKPDGKHMYITGGGFDRVADYELSDPWNITSQTLGDVIDITVDDSDPTGIYFRSDGKKMYIAGDAGNTVIEYSLSTPWNITTTYSTKEHSLGSVFFEDIFFSPDGRRMYVLDDVGNEVEQYELGLIMGGKLGIGTITPSSGVHVIGNMNATGDINATGEVCDSQGCLSDIITTPPYGWVQTTAGNTHASSVFELGQSVTETSATGNGVSWDSTGNEFDIAETGVYEVLVDGLLGCTSASRGEQSISINLSIEVNDSEMNKQITTCYTAHDPVERNILWVGTVGNGGRIDAEIVSSSGTSDVGWENGSSMTVKRIG